MIYDSVVHVFIYPAQYNICFTSLLPTCTDKMSHRNIKRLIKKERKKLSNNIIGRQWTRFPVKINDGYFAIVHKMIRRIFPIFKLRLVRMTEDKNVLWILFIQ